MSEQEVNTVRSRWAASHIRRTGDAASGAYWWNSSMSKPILPLLATKPGCPSVMPDSTAWKPARESSAADTCARESLYAAEDRVELISSR